MAESTGPEMDEAAELALNGFGNPGELPVSVLSDIRQICDGEGITFVDPASTQNVTLRNGGTGLPHS